MGRGKRRARTGVRVAVAKPITALDRAAKEYRSTGCDLYRELVRRCPVPSPQTSAGDGRKDSLSIDAAWAKSIEARLPGHTFPFCGAEAQVELIGGRDTFDLVIHYLGQAYPGNFKASSGAKSQRNNVFGVEGFYFLLTGCRRKAKHKQMAEVVLALKDSERSFPSEPVDYFFVHYNKTTSAIDIFPLMAITPEGLQAGASVNSTCGLQMNFSACAKHVRLDQPWEESCRLLLDLYIDWAESRAQPHMILAGQTKRQMAQMHRRAHAPTKVAPAKGEAKSQTTH